MKWISVKDQLPNKDGVYLIYVCCQDSYGHEKMISYIDTAPFYNSQFHCHSECCKEEEPLEPQPTHWMPLPDYPKDSNEMD